MAFNYNKLRGKIREYGTQGEFADAMGMARTTLSAKLNNYTEWGQSEILKACEILNIPLDAISVYFFTLEVQELEQN